MGKSNKIFNIKGIFNSFKKKRLADSFQEFSLSLLLISPLLIFLFYVFLPQVPNDWSTAFYVAAETPFEPYQVPLYNYPPWLALILAPFSFFSLRFSQALNAFAALYFVSLLVVRSKGTVFSLIITFTSFPFFALLGNASVDWVVAAGFVFASVWAVPLVLAKPQTGFLVLFIWFKRSTNKKQFLLAGFLFFLVTLLIWGLWPLDAWRNIQEISVMKRVNSSFFPWSIPVGLYLLYYAWKNDDELAAVGATLCVSPYFAPQSLIVGFAILAARYRKVALVVSILLWIYW